MRRLLEPQFSWRGVVLIAIAFTLIGLAVLFRSSGTPVVTASTTPPVPASSSMWHMFGALGVIVLLVVAAGFGICCGYIHQLHRLRKQMKEYKQPSPKKT